MARRLSNRSASSPLEGFLGVMGLWRVLGGHLIGHLTFASALPSLAFPQPRLLTCEM